MIDRTQSHPKAIARDLSVMQGASVLTVKPISQLLDGRVDIENALSWLLLNCAIGYLYQSKNGGI